MSGDIAVLTRIPYRNHKALSAVLAHKYPAKSFHISRGDAEAQSGWIGNKAGTEIYGQVLMVRSAADVSASNTLPGIAMRLGMFFALKFFARNVEVNMIMLVVPYP